MNKEELEKEADGYVHIHWTEDEEHDALVKQAYLASAEPREKQIDELRAQIEKMKNCKNCKKLKKEKDGLLVCTVGSFYTNTFGKGCDKWELAE